MRHETEPWPTVAVRQSRLLRPFPIKRLQDRILFQLLAQAGQIETEVQRLLSDPPSTPEPWVDSLHRIGAWVETLADLCDEAAPLLELLIEQADGDYRRAVDAMVAIIRGIGEPPEPLEAGEAPAQVAA